MLIQPVKLIGSDNSIKSVEASITTLVQQPTTNIPDLQYYTSETILPNLEENAISSNQTPALQSSLKSSKRKNCQSGISSPASPALPHITLTSLSWNIEGIKRNLFSLKNFTELTKPDLIFLSEPLIFSTDLPYCMSFFKGDYCSELNSEDKINTETAMRKSKPTGGTMILWKGSLDSFISTHPTSSTSFLPIILQPPGSPVSVHIALYLPTSGREGEFLEQIIQLSNCISDITDKYGDNCLIFLRGDANVNSNNNERVKIFENFLSLHNLVQVKIDHKTYHHFLGGGAFDSNIDIVSHSKDSTYNESVSTIFCKHDYPEIESHHDIIISSVFLPVEELPTPEADLVTAPRMKHTRHKIVWSEDGIARYQEEVAGKLSEIRKKWLNPLSKTSMSILLSLSNETLCKTAILTNKSENLNQVRKLSSKKEACRN